MAFWCSYTSRQDIIDPQARFGCATLGNSFCIPDSEVIEKSSSITLHSSLLITWNSVFLISSDQDNNQYFIFKCSFKVSLNCSFFSHRRMKKMNNDSTTLKYRKSQTFKNKHNKPYTWWLLDIYKYKNISIYVMYIYEYKRHIDLIIEYQTKSKRLNKVPLYL